MPSGIFDCAYVSLFNQFTLSWIDTGEAIINVRQSGSGPLLLLLNGHRQTHVMWNRVAPRPTEYFTVVAPDLRGYRDSSKPPTAVDHASHSKCRMARDHVSVMRHLGFEYFCVAGYDRGAAVRTAWPWPIRSRCATGSARHHPDRRGVLAD